MVTSRHQQTNTSLKAWFIGYFGVSESPLASHQAKAHFALWSYGIQWLKDCDAIG
jgi:hypothetical protein